MVTKTTKDYMDTTPEWEGYTAICKAKGLRSGWVAERMGLKVPNLWYILHRRYGYPRPDGFEDKLAEVLQVPRQMIFQEASDGEG